MDEMNNGMEFEKQMEDITDELKETLLGTVDKADFSEINKRITEDVEIYSEKLEKIKMNMPDGGWKYSELNKILKKEFNIKKGVSSRMLSKYVKLGLVHSSNMSVTHWTYDIWHLYEILIVLELSNILTPKLISKYIEVNPIRNFDEAEERFIEMIFSKSYAKHTSKEFGIESTGDSLLLIMMASVYLEAFKESVLEKLHKKEENNE